MAITEALGGRKFILAVITIAVGTAVQILSPSGVNESFAALLIGITAAFGASNAFVTKASLNAPAPLEVEQAPTVDLTATEGRIDELYSAQVESQAKLTSIEEQLHTIANSLFTVAQTAEAASKAAKVAISVSR